MKVGKGKTFNKSDVIIILAIVIVVGICITALVREITGTSHRAPVLEEGKDYDINYSDNNTYIIVDENGNTIELERVSTEVFRDRNGKMYRFVSGSPFKYVGEYKEGN